MEHYVVCQYTSYTAKFPHPVSVVNFSSPSLATSLALDPGAPQPQNWLAVPIGYIAGFPVASEYSHPPYGPRMSVLLGPSPIMQVKEDYALQIK